MGEREVKGRNGRKKGDKRKRSNRYRERAGHSWVERARDGLIGKEKEMER